MRVLSFLLLLVLVASVFTACEEDEPIGFLPPETKIFVDSIGRDGEGRLGSTVQLYWFGEDPDGFLSGYELAIDTSNTPVDQLVNTPDQLAWGARTQRTDSLIQFEISLGSQFQDFRFFVRAIDETGLIDPTPAVLIVPVKNTPPTASFVAEQMPRDTVQSIITVGFTAADIDGEEAVQSIQLKVNDGNWVSLPASARVASFKPTTPGTDGVTTAEIWTGLNPNSLQLISELATDMRIGDTNRVYVRAVDDAGFTSEEDTSGSIFIRRQQGDWLVIGTSTNGPFDVTAPEDLYIPTLNNLLGPKNFDYLRQVTRFPSRVDSNNVPQLGNTTYELLFRQYEVVFWYGSAQYLPELEEAAPVLENHLNRDNKLFVIWQIPTQLDEQSTLFDFTPATRRASDSLLPQIPNGNTVFPASGLDVSYPTLTNRSGSTFSRAIAVEADQVAQPIYYGDLLANTPPTPSDWVADSTLMMRTQRNIGGIPRTNFIYSCIEFHLLGDINDNDFDALFTTIRNEFDW